MLEDIFNPWRLKWYPRMILAGLAIGFLIAILYGKGARTLTGRLGGDFPSLYGSGCLIAEGRANELYNLESQLSVQKNFLPGEDNKYLCYANPPYFALIYAPFSYINYRLAFFIHTLLMVGALLLTLYLISPLIDVVKRHFLCAFTITVLFYPILRSILGGQNTPLTLLVIASTLHEITNGKEYLAGIILGLLLFKPQFAVPLMGIFLLAGYWKVVIGSMFTTALFYAIGAWMQGLNWVTTWFKFALWFTHVDSIVNCKNAVSWLGFFQCIFGSEAGIALILGWGMAIVTIVGLSLLWWIGGKQADIISQIGLASVCIILISPHIMYYDTGLLLFTFLALIVKLKKQGFLLISILWFLGFSQALSGLLGFSPLFLVVVFTLLIGIHRLALPVLKDRKLNKGMIAH